MKKTYWLMGYYYNVLSTEMNYRLFTKEPKMVKSGRRLSHKKSWTPLCDGEIKRIFPKEILKEMKKYCKDNKVLKVVRKFEVDFGVR